MKRTSSERQAVSETMRLYTAWIAVLMEQLGTDVIRVRAGEIAGALDGFACAVSREGDEYVIRLDGPCGGEGAPEGREAEP